ncbi:penicillin-binding protein 2 [Leptolyngbya sp. FACHB-321]|uniref:peptidoglycan D,D-transpeptidase FtsI family protein n=1 Tax=Leptolyngbya sp. FACHB-321 TaxID=2692807 RepID=UPI0016878737|nr:penicillin-binding protein 2 [Leptolyngbya sp. FACHB-321]MBD2034784.1 penicillin-binding protein 2 [Leptolyngbya sp. FACHB-321]
MSNPPRSLSPQRVRRLPVGSRPKRIDRTALVNQPTFRLVLVWGALTVGCGLLLLNLGRLQIAEAPALQKLAQEQQMLYMRPFVPRRQIIDRTGTVLALDRPVYTLFAHPKLFKESKQAIAEKLAPLLQKSTTDLTKKLDQGETGIRVEYALSESVADQVANLKADGLELLQSQQRLYPHKDMAADVLGYVNDEHKGQAGLELSQQRLLERIVSPVRLRRMGDGSLMPDQVPGGFLNVDDWQLQLTLDSRLQRVAIAALQQQVTKFDAKRGTVIVMDVRDGSLLTLASTPSYDPNQYFKYPLDRFKNWALSDLYEPGSTFKPINVAIALETGSVKPDTPFYDEGQIQVSGWPIQNFDYSSSGGRGNITLSEILEYSSNVGMVHVVQQIKPSVYYTWLKRLGMGELVGIDLPSETAGQFKDKKTFLESPIERATTSFGQGFSLTPIHLVQMHAVLANGGRLVTPHIVRGLFDSKGQPYWQPNFPTKRPVFSKATSQTVMAMMEAVVSKGTGKSAQIPGYRIGGKTGTAQKANPNGGYLDRAKITSFVGVFPIESPRYVVLAVVDEPKGGDAFGSTVAAPIVKAVMGAIISLEKIPPSVSVTSEVGR